MIPQQVGLSMDAYQNQGNGGIDPVTAANIAAAAATISPGGGGGAAAAADGHENEN